MENVKNLSKQFSKIELEVLNEYASNNYYRVKLFDAVYIDKEAVKLLNESGEEVLRIEVFCFTGDNDRWLQAKRKGEYISDSLYTVNDLKDYLNKAGKWQEGRK